MGEKCQNPTFFWAKPVSGTGTKKWYWYPWYRGQVVSIPLKVVLVPIGNEGLVLVPLLPATLFLHIYAPISPMLVHQLFRDPKK